MNERLTRPAQELASLTRTGNSLKVRGFEKLPIDQMTDRALGVEVLDLSSSALIEIPDQLPEIFPNTRVIFLSDVEMRSLPVALKKFESLQMLGMRGCGLQDIHIDRIPDSLEVLTLTNNSLQEIPADIGRLKKLKKLMLSGNLISELPDTLDRCDELEMIRISENRLNEEPDVLHRLSKLSWYTDSGNPYHARVGSDRALQNIDAARLQLIKEVGKSANNVVYASVLDDSIRVAVKIYGSTVSTDGSVDNELEMFERVDGIDGIVGAIGVTRLDDGRIAAIMPLIPDTFTQLAGPPNLSAFTRDVYDSGRIFTRDQADTLVYKTTRTIEELHFRGVSHGDIYAHNILFNGDDSLLNDFGAASTIDESSVKRTIDLRALDILSAEIEARVRS